MTTTSNAVAEEWGRAIKAQRQLLGMSQDTLAQLVGVTQGTVSRWERGQSQPEHRLIPKISKELGAAPGVLFRYPQAVA